MWKTLESFYKSDEWIDFRSILIAERGPICQECKRTISQPKDIIGHHTIELTIANVNDRTISLNKDVVKIVCFDCHNKIHKRFGYAIKKNEKGIYLVYGPPLSGKTSFVKEHKGRNDIVVDMDRLFEAITLLDRYDKPDILKYNVLALRNALIDNIKTRYGKFHNAWIIGGYEAKHNRDYIIKQLGAVPILIEATKEECLQRLSIVDDYRKYNYSNWEKYIKSWFDNYS